MTQSARLYNVYVERPRSPAPGAVAKLAQAMATHYGIAAGELERRLASGRFRVKGNVDRVTADSFAGDLARLGAVVLVSPVEDTPPPAPVSGPAAVAPGPVSLQQPRVAAPIKPAAPAVAAPAVAAPAVATPAVAAPAVAAPAPARPQYTSGLSAAAAAPSDEAGMGALAGELPLTLSMLDDSDDLSSSGSRSAVGLPASFGPPPDTMGGGPGDDIDVSMDDDDDAPALEPDRLLAERAAHDGAGGAPRQVGLPASFGPAAGMADLGSRPSSGGPALTGPTDLFAPPEATAELEFALDVEPQRKKKQASIPPPVAAHEPATATPPAPTPRSSGAHPVARPPGEPAWRSYGRDERVRFVAGVVIAAALGAVPAMLISSVRERSAFAELDGKLEDRQEVEKHLNWDGLDRVRTSFIERKRAERQSIALTSLLIWAVISGGVAWLWFRKIDWDRVLGPAPR